MKHHHFRQRLASSLVTALSGLVLLSELPTAQAQNEVSGPDVFLEGRQIHEAARESEGRRKTWSTLTKLAMAGAAITLLVNNRKKKMK